VKERRGIDHARRTGDPSPRTRARGVERRHDLVVEHTVPSESVEKLFVILEVLGKLRGELRHGKPRVGAEVFDRAFDARARTVPHLALGIARPDEQDRLVLRVLGRHDQHRFGLVESGEVVKVGVLPVLVLDVVVADCYRRRRKNRDAVPELGHQRLASTRVEAHSGFRG
jgi:hypothetical protein